MSYGHVYNHFIFETLGIMSSLQYTDSVWNDYEEFAISKIEDANLRIRGAVSQSRNLKNSEAEKELLLLEKMIPVINQFEKSLESSNDEKFRAIKDSFQTFLASVKELHKTLEELADKHHHYKISTPVLSEDWDSEEDDHWDNY
ncbi:hypothetical protein F3059_11045 [Salibacter halophilus]|uniref:Uncharacterized protein n=2 Tax=Salibacter halophilus TaxID=1803916 RepID=A0A6N6M7W3_9FLAO|nr:hypothetical protein F3059_11045 [Salibacter halophilus]